MHPGREIVEHICSVIFIVALGIGTLAAKQSDEVKQLFLLGTCRLGQRCDERIGLIEKALQGEIVPAERNKAHGDDDGCCGGAKNRRIDNCLGVQVIKRQHSCKDSCKERKCDSRERISSDKSEKQFHSCLTFR